MHVQVHSLIFIRLNAILLFLHDAIMVLNPNIGTSGKLYGIVREHTKQYTLSVVHIRSPTLESSPVVVNIK